MKFIQFTLLIFFVLTVLYILSNSLFPINTEIAKKDINSSNNISGSNSDLSRSIRPADIISPDPLLESAFVTDFQDATQSQSTDRVQGDNSLEPINILLTQELLSSQYASLVNGLSLSIKEKDELTLEMISILASLNSQITVGDISQQEYQRLLIFNMEELFLRYLTDEEMRQFYEYEIETDPRLRGRNELASGMYGDSMQKIPGISEEQRMSIAIIMAEEHMAFIQQATALENFKGFTDDGEEIVNLRLLRAEKIEQRIENLLNGTQLVSTLDYLYENHHMLNLELGN